MALLSFPPSPTSGDLYPTAPIVGQSQYQWDATNSTWVLLGAATAVTPGCYGDATNVASFCVDAQGRIISALNVPLSSVSPDLQIVTDQGAVTTNTVTVAGLIAAGLIYPSADGANGDVMVTDGAGLLSFVAPSIDDLQTVTDNGAVTTNTVTVAGLVAAGLTYPLADGTLGDVLVTDGGGNLGFVTPPVEDLDSVTTAGNTTANGIDVGSLTAASLIYPTSDGTANQVMTTDGANNLGWLTTLKVVPVPALNTDPGNLGEVAVGAGFFYFFDGGQWLKVAGVPV